jgi:putative solute:sodium symporter small subunit
MTGVLLFIWFVTTFVIGFFARDLTFTVMGWPFSFWVASQGSLIVYMLIIVSLLTKAPEKNVQDLVEHVRYPNLAMAR